MNESTGSNSTLGDITPSNPMPIDTHSSGRSVPDPQLADRPGSALAALFTGDTVDLVTRLSLVLLLFSNIIVSEDWYFQVALRVPAVLGLILPPLHRSRVLWGVIAAVMVTKTISHAVFQDNHLYLVTYWYMAVFIAICSKDAGRVLAINARLMIGLAFALAMVWKAALSTEFLDSRYFQFTLLTDSRFAEISSVVGNLEPTAAAQNRAAWQALFNPNDSGEAIELTRPVALTNLAYAMTWYTVLIESLVAVAFLWPNVGRGVSRFRDYLLMIFGVSVYVIAPVTTFGWTLMTMGLAQLEPNRGGVRRLYIAALAVMLLYEFVPLTQIVHAFTNS